MATMPDDVGEYDDVGDGRPDGPVDVFDAFRRDAALSHGELWLRYFELGGMSTGLQLEAYIYGALRPSRHDHDLIAHALNERFVEMGGNHPVPYADDDPGVDGTGRTV
jgi:hypothetical protein